MIRLAIIAQLALISVPAAGVQQEPQRTHPRPLPAEPIAQTATFETSDGIEIVANFYPQTNGDREKAPVAVLIHMYRSDRNSWSPIVPALHGAGFAVLAYDIRGTGDSKNNDALAGRYRQRKSSLFRDAWKDAQAAVKWLAAQPGGDAGRIVCIGASIGCSIALDYGHRNDDVRAIVCLSPGIDYFGVDSITHIKACGMRPILLCAPEAERSTPKQLKKAGRNVTIDIRPGTRAQHGTGMFDKDYGPDLIQRIVAFVREPVARMTPDK